MHAHSAYSGVSRAAQSAIAVFTTTLFTGDDEPTQTDVAVELFEVVACDEQDLPTLGVFESSRRELCESR
jgi:hypothetical protein